MKLTVDQSIRKAAKLASRGEKREAERIYREVLQSFPANERALKGLRALSTPTPEPLPPQEVQSLVLLYNQGRLQELIERASALLQRYPDAVTLYNLAGVAKTRQGRFEEAIAGFDKALSLKPDYADASNNRGIALQNLGRLDEALASFDKALQQRPGYADAYYNRGLVLQDLKRPDDALASFDKAVQLRPDYGEAFDNRGTVLRELKRLDEAIASFDKALQLNPAYAIASYNRANVLREQRRLEEALASYDNVLLLEPDHAQTYHNRGNILWELKRLDDALASYDKALQLKPDYAEAYHNRGAALYDLGRLHEALASHDKALHLRPDYAEAHNDRGIVLQQLKRLDEALASYAEALRLRPHYAEACHNERVAAAHMCKWEETASAAPMPDIQGEAVPPFATMILADDPLQQLERARTWVKAKYRSPRPALPNPDTRAEKIRIGYFSADFHDHASMHLMAKVLELHDRSRFEIHAFSFGADAQDAMRQRAAGAVDRFHDVRALDDAAIAELARNHRIDIAVDLNGHTNNARMGIFACRPAAIQINYLGYPGSTGADFIDYIIADEVVAPHGSRKHFTEKLISLPQSYQANDNGRVISDRRFGRAELGLPADGFVFCCFNNNYKIRAAEFDIWMRLVAAIEGSVLWLLRDNEWAEGNLRREAEARGVSSSRLVFAERMPPADHLARHRCADLFLDTFNYNAHTTASDALWAGLPVVTKLGKSFAARVAGSLLNAIDMPELVTETSEAYERLALDLATDPGRLAAVRAKLAANRLTTPLFDTERFTRDIERAYALAYERLFNGLPADHIKV